MFTDSKSGQTHSFTPLTEVIMKRGEEFIEQGADLEHDRWARWHIYCRRKSNRFSIYYYL